MSRNREPKHPTTSTLLSSSAETVRFCAAARQMGQRQVPVMGVNLGKLGFLADLRPDQVADVFSKVCAGDCRIIHHLMFTCTVVNQGEVLSGVAGVE